MKPYCLISLFLTSLAMEAWSQNADEVPMSDAATHQQLVLAYRKVSQEDPMRDLKPVKGSDPSLANRPKDLISESDILCFRGMATLVPKRAILNIPKNLAERLKFQAGSGIQSWADFYAQNRGWITTVEVSRVQAEGNKPLAEEISNRIGKSSSLVVATYQGGPISVLPLKVPVDGAKEVPIQTAKVK